MCVWNFEITLSQFGNSQLGRVSGKYGTHTQKKYEKLWINLLMRPSFPRTTMATMTTMSYPDESEHECTMCKKAGELLNRINRKDINYNIFIIYDDFNKQTSKKTDHSHRGPICWNTYIVLAGRWLLAAVADQNCLFDFARISSNHIFHVSMSYHGTLWGKWVI